MKEKTLLLLSGIILFALLLMIFLPNAGASEFTYRVIEKDGFYYSQCYVNGVLYTTVEKGVCEKYAIISDDGSILNTGVKRVDTKEMRGVSATSRTIGEHYRNRSDMLQRIHELRHELIELQRNL